jgi:flagella basal body P-ring formation protein FlgA
MIMAFPFLLAVSASPQACQALQADTILARDVAAVVPDFGRVAADLHMGYVSATGAPRVFRGADLQRIARNQGFELPDAPDVCFVLKTFVPQPGEIEAAMRTTLSSLPGIANAKFSIIASSQHPVPTGELIFPRAGLQQPAGGAREVLWRGFVRHEEEQFPVWAKARITVNTTRIVAAKDIPAGKPIQAIQIRMESCEDSLLDQTTARQLDEVLGYIPKSLLRADLPIRRSQIAAPADIVKGEIVNVEVFAGAAHLVVQGKAQTEGIRGSNVTIRNVSSGKDFSARVVGKSRAVVGDSVQ